MGLVRGQQQVAFLLRLLQELLMLLLVQSRLFFLVRFLVVRVAFEGDAIIRELGLPFVEDILLPVVPVREVCLVRSDSNKRGILVLSLLYGF